MQDVHLLHPPYEVPLPGEILPPAPPNIHEEQINSPDGHRHVAVPADTQWNSVGGPVVDRVLDNDFVLAVPPTYILGEPSHVRIAYLQAIYNNVFNKMPVRATNDNLEATLQSLDAAGVLPTFPSPVKTLAGAKRRLGIDPTSQSFRTPSVLNVGSTIPPHSFPCFCLPPVRNVDVPEWFIMRKQIQKATSSVSLSL